MYIPSAISLGLLKLALEFPAMLVRWCQMVAGSFASEGAVAVDPVAVPKNLELPSMTIHGE